MTAVSRAALAARPTMVNWIEDRPGAWTAANLGKEPLIVVADGEFEARLARAGNGAAIDVFGVFGGTGSRELRGRVGIGPLTAALFNAGSHILLRRDAHTLFGLQRLPDK